MKRENRTDLNENKILLELFNKKYLFTVKPLKSSNSFFLTRTKRIEMRQNKSKWDQRSQK